MERTAFAIGEAGDAVGLGFRRVLAAQFLDPARRQLRADVVETLRVQHRIQRHRAVVGFDDRGIAIQCADHLAGFLQCACAGAIALGEHHDVRELHLFGQQVHQRAVVVRARGFPAVAQTVGGAEVADEGFAVDHRHHGVQAGDVRQREAVFVAHRECRRDRHRFRDPGRFDQQVIEAALVRQALHFLAQIVAQRAADAAVAEFDQLFLGARQLRAAVADQRAVDVDLAHVVDDDRHPLALAVAQHVIEQGGLAGAEETGKDGDGEARVARRFDGRHEDAVPLRAAAFACW